MARYVKVHACYNSWIRYNISLFETILEYGRALMPEGCDYQIIDNDHEKDLMSLL